MKQTIKNRWSGATLYEGEHETFADAVAAHYANRTPNTRADLSGADLSRANLSGADLYGADLSRADLSGADLSRANLSGADLSRADLSRADLSGADLYGANLSGADLSGADLSRANLSGATGVDPWRSTPILMLLDQPGKMRAYKLVDAEGRSPIHSSGKLAYPVGAHLEQPGANTNVNESCAAGINVATFDWCAREWREGYRVMLVEFTAADIAAIPTATDGKFRLHRCDVVGEVDIASRGLTASESLPPQTGEAVSA